MDKLKAMRGFVRIVDAGSLTKAAKNAGTSLASMVRLLSDLERNLGVRLMNRTTRRLALTDEGAVYLESCKQILKDIDNAEAQLTLKHPTPSGQLTITAPEKFGHLHVYPLVEEYLSLFDEVRIALRLSNKRIDMIENNIDFSIRIGVLKDSTLIAKKLGSVREKVVATPELIKNSPKLKKPEDLSQVNCGLYFDDTIQKSWQYETGGEKKAIPIFGNISTNNIEVGLSACRRGKIFGRFLSYQVKQELDEGSLQEVLNDFPQPDWPVSIVYPSARLLPYRTRHAIDWFYEKLSAREFA